MIAILLTLALGADCNGGQCSAARAPRVSVQVTTTRTVHRERGGKLFHRRGRTVAGRCK
ncbi:hypothetical protein UFOVP822_19 [uncultured Caudovirales phage]|uniref:Uncharacterized protein n=1 Tax=uncultured Caudovirales phage TaxID=2100421 RepID=A0A6J5P1H1_9CAUD|nr:hypothetical protein UFOVP822_19 [uncultured Caudovirales phage]